MEGKKRYGIWKILLTTLWVCVGTGVVILLVAGIRKKDSKVCSSVEISITGVDNNYFVDKDDVMNTITRLVGGNPVGKPTGSVNLRKIETELRMNTWIKGVELFFDNNEKLQVKIKEREPLARLFTISGASFYLDGDIDLLPLSDKYSARLPVFTGFPVDDKVLSPADSSLLRDVLNISLAIQKDSFLMAMIDQVDITPQRSFEMIPKIGNQLIVFGDGSDVDAKFEKLKLFYKQVMVKAGWTHYSTISLQYKGQVVAKIRGAEDIAADSLRTLQLIQLIALNAERQAADSMQIRQPVSENNTADSTMIQQSIQRDNDASDENGDAAPTAAKDSGAVKVESKPVVKKPMQPAKAVMPKKRN